MHPFVLNDAVLGSELDLNNIFVTAKIPWWECSRETHMFCHISYCSQLPCSTFLGHSFLAIVWSFHIQNLICWVVSNFHRLFQNEIQENSTHHSSYPNSNTYGFGHIFLNGRTTDTDCREARITPKGYQS